MATIIFDIATAGVDWNELAQRTRHQLTRFTDPDAAKEKLGLSPLTGRIIALGLLDLERRQGMVYVAGGERGDPAYKSRTETELLEDFWEGAQSYDVFVTFGGRRFDIPFLLHRSAALGVTPTQEFRFARHVEKQQVPYHIDLHDELTRHGDLRAPVTLHLLCRAYGIDSPDEGKVTGETVGECFRKEAFAELAAHTEANVSATTTLYERWLTHFAPHAFLNTLL